MNWKIVHIAETNSTNQWLRTHRTHGDCPLGEERSGLQGDCPRVSESDASDETSDTLVLVADYQTAGRGCGTNTWESERGANLLYSMLIHPATLPANRQYLISMAVANSIAKVLSDYVGNVSIKWPNDIYVGDSKICGILIENQLQGSSIKDSIIGVGFNVNQLRFESDAPNPISLAHLTGRTFDRSLILQQLLAAFDAEWTDLENVRSRYLPQLYRRTGSHPYRDVRGEFMAELVTVEDDGHLVLRDADGDIRRYAFKEVQFVSI